MGKPWRADVTTDGAIEPWDGTARLGWLVAADDRWHDPAVDTGVRHGRVEGTAVFETRIRVPGGDAVQRVWSVADHGGLTLLEVTNASSLPIACAFTRSDVMTARPPASVPTTRDVTGIDLPEGTIVLPVGHRACVTVALAHGGTRGGVIDPDRPAAALPSGLPTSDAVVRGWRGRTDAASRLELPEPALAEAVRAARCEVLLTGLPVAHDEPEHFLLAACELVRMGELDAAAAAELALDVADAVEAVARGSSPRRDATLVAAAVVLSAAGEGRAVDDVTRLLSQTPRRAELPVAARDDITVVADIETMIAAGGALFPGGIPAAWRGTDFEAHGLLAGPTSRLSLAVRWHGENAAVLWQVDGAPVRLSSNVATGGWHTDDASGEALWRLDRDVTSAS